VELAKQNIVTQTNQADILRKNIAYATVRAPVSGMTTSAVLHDEGDCPPSLGVAVRAALDGADVTAVFPRWPEEGAVYDLSVPGTSDFVVVSATQGRATYCVPEENASGVILVNHFERVGTRYLANVEVSGVAAGAATLDGDLFH